MSGALGCGGLGRGWDSGKADRGGFGGFRIGIRFLIGQRERVFSDRL